MDTANTIWPTATLDECLRLALHEYSDASPLQFETVITLPGDSREIALAALTGLEMVSDVWWPYDSAATTETWPPNRVAAGGSIGMTFSRFSTWKQKTMPSRNSMMAAALVFQNKNYTKPGQRLHYNRAGGA